MFYSLYCHFNLCDCEILDVILGGLKMKEKLMELLKNSVDDCTGNKLEHIADYLIENGVFLLPGKIENNLVDQALDWSGD